MDKNTFISELRSALRVLQEDELEDIINEYEQHIDMKMENGQTEDEAIADFGSLSELTADILEAYHVRADYAAEQKQGKKSVFGDDGAAGAGRELLLQTGKTCRAASEKAVHGLRELGIWLWGVLLFWKRQLVRPIRWAAARWNRFRHQKADKIREASAIVENDGSLTDENDGWAQPEDSGENAETASSDFSEAADSVNNRVIAKNGPAARIKYPRTRKRRGDVFGRLGEGILSMVGSIFRFGGRCVHLGLSLCLWGMRMAWNVCWIGFALCCAAMGLFCLFVFGLLAVLWMQRYPLAGVTLGCLGLVLCMFSAAAFALTLIWRKKRQRAGHADDSTPGSQDASGDRFLTVEDVQGYREMEGEQHA